MKKLRLLGILIILLFLSSCGAGGGGDGDTTPPTASSPDPADGATDVPVDTVITVSFSEAMDDSTITDSTFTLSNNPPVLGTVSYDPVTMTATFTPSSNLAVSTIYTATITTGVTDSAGNALESDYTWSFTSTGPIQLPKTGQTTCYDELGAPRACTGTGEDGEILAGVEWPDPRFVELINPDGTVDVVLDELTGLMWTQDGNAPGPAGCSPGVNKTWQEALNYVDCLNTNNYLGYNDWRLPNRKEYQSLIDYSQYDPTLPSPNPFTNVAVVHWSSTTYAGGTDRAWWVSIGGSPEVVGSFKDGLPVYSGAVWLVRAGQ